MKKFAFIALALGLFVAACNSGGTSSTGDSTANDTSINSAVPEAPAAPIDTTTVAPVDTTVTPADTAAHH